MFFFTHLYIAKVLYRHLSQQFPLDQHAFSYGNIKPDLPGEKDKHHTLEECFVTMCDISNRLMEGKLAVKDFSVGLGEVCHYVSDFFCYYHLNEELHNKNLKHFIYEVWLHLELIRKHKQYSYKVFSKNMEPRKDILSIVFDMRLFYYINPRGLRRDIDYAVLSSVWISESIICNSKNSLDIQGEELPLPSDFIMEGMVRL